jgi:hypothetical protein
LAIETRDPNISEAESVAVQLNGDPQDEPSAHDGRDRVPGFVVRGQPQLLGFPPSHIDTVDNQADTCPSVPLVPLTKESLLAHGSTSVGFRDDGPEITSRTLTWGEIERSYVEITWKSEDESSDLTIFLDLDEAVTFIQDLSTVVFAAKAGVFTKDDE